MHKGKLPSPEHRNTGLGLATITQITDLSDDDFSEGEEDSDDFGFAAQASELMHCVFIFLDIKDIVEASFACSAWLIAASRVPPDTHFLRKDETLEYWEGLVGFFRLQAT